MLEDKTITVCCYALGVVLAVVACFFDVPVDLFVAGLALACMLRVVAVAFLQKMCWKTIAFRLMLLAGIAFEMSFFYDFMVGKVLFGGLFCIGLGVSFFNLLVFINGLSGDENWVE